MRAASVERLLVRHGARVGDADLRRLDAAIDAARPLPGIRTRQRVLPWGTITNFTGAGGVGSAPVFEPSVRISGGRAEVRWLGPRALIAGLVPVHLTPPREIFSAPRPALLVTEADFAGGDEVGVYFRVEVDSAEFRPIRVSPVVLAKLPPPMPRTAFKLALFLRRRAGAISYVPAEDRVLFCSQSFFAANRRSDGTFSPIFAAEF